MKKFLALALFSVACTACSKAPDSGKTEYLVFTGIKRNSADKSDYSAVFYSDSSFVIQTEEKHQGKWEDTKKGLKLSLSGESLYTEYDRASASHYFFYKDGSGVYKFYSQDSEYLKNRNPDYKPGYETMTQYRFEGEGRTSGIKTTGILLFLSDETKTVYYAPIGRNGIQTDYLNIGNHWKEENSVFSFDRDDKKYVSEVKDQIVSFLINDISYYLK